MKKCCNCNETNPIRFWKDKNSPDGLCRYCKQCSKTKWDKWRKKNKKHINKQARLWRKNNLEKAHARSAKYYKNNRDKIRKRRAKYNKAHPIRIKRQKQKYVENNKEKVRESKQKWREAHPELVQAWHTAGQRKRDARKLKATIGNIKDIRNFYIHVHTSKKIKCYYCGKSIPKGKRIVEHKTPLSRGGAHSLRNLTPSCYSCNNKKFMKTEKEFYEYLERKKNKDKADLSILKKDKCRSSVN